MKLFFKDLSFFLAVLLTVMLIGIFILPLNSQNSSNSLYFSKIEKDTLLKDTPSPRIILVGGSNLSFGINSQQLKDSLNINPINTSVHAGTGLKYMLDNTLRFVKQGDIIIIAPEYEHFFEDRHLGKIELWKTLFDVSPETFNLLSTKQILHLSKSLPEYAFSKYKFWENIDFNPNEIGVYERYSFNEYGDEIAHWNKKNEKFSPEGTIKGDFNPEVIELLNDFQKNAEEKGATVYFSFPSLQSDSFNNSKEKIQKVYQELQKSGLTLISTPEENKFEDSLFYNSHYHLNKIGIELRTEQLIADLKKYIH